jgi:hypothetical protein
LMTMHAVHSFLLFELSSSFLVELIEVVASKGTDRYHALKE